MLICIKSWLLAMLLRIPCRKEIGKTSYNSRIIIVLFYIKYFLCEKKIWLRWKVQGGNGEDLLLWFQNYCLWFGKLQNWTFFILSCETGRTRGGECILKVKGGYPICLQSSVQLKSTFFSLPKSGVVLRIIVNGKNDGSPPIELQKT